MRIELLKLQSSRLRLPLDIIEIPYPCSNEIYETTMSQYVERAKKKGVNYFAYGDLFLADIRQYRIKTLEGTGIEAIFPLWEESTNTLAKEMISEGLKAVTTCVDTEQLSHNFVGKEFNEDFLETLPKTVDPCGENGEFHTFVYDGPMFSETIKIRVEESVKKERFSYADIKLSKE